MVSTLRRTIHGSFLLSSKGSYEGALITPRTHCGNRYCQWERSKLLIQGHIAFRSACMRIFGRYLVGDFRVLLMLQRGLRNPVPDRFGFRASGPGFRVR